MSAGLGAVERRIARMQHQHAVAKLTASPRYTDRGPERGVPPPRDTRSLTARVLGDPLPGRSALDWRRAG